MSNRDIQRSNTLAGVLAEMDRNRETLESMFPAGVSYDEFRSVTIHMLRTSPDVLECTSDSIINALTQAAYDGLNPDGKQAVVIKRNTKVARNPDRYEKRAHYMPMIAGVRLRIIRNSRGAVHDVQALIVYENEPFRMLGGLNPSIEHEICPDATKRGEPIGVYAFARYTNGGPATVEYLTVHEIKRIQAQADDRSSVWVDFWDQMWKKSALRRLEKSLPLLGPVRDAEAAMMFPQYRAAVDLPAPGDAARAPAEPQAPRPRRQDYPALEHREPDPGLPDQRPRQEARDEPRARSQGQNRQENQRILPPREDSKLLNSEELKKRIIDQKTPEACSSFWKGNQTSIQNLPEPERQEVEMIFQDHVADLAAGAGGHASGVPAENQGAE